MTSPGSTSGFPASSTKVEIEEGDTLMPRFDDQGLLPCVTVDAATGEVLMLAYMNAQALARTIETREAWYWSRSRNALWRKGETSGQIQSVIDLRIDCDQDAILLKVQVGGDGGCCHTGRRSCFYRSVRWDGPSREPRLSFDSA